MKIRDRLILGFLTVALLVGTGGYISIDISQNALKESIEENSMALIIGTLDKIDRDIHNRIEQLQIHAKTLGREEILIDSNERFDQLDDVGEYIKQIDKKWTSLPKEVITPFIQELIDNSLSRELRTEVELDRRFIEKYGYQVFGEIFVTNKYGANIAQTDKTTDYYQADEEWWQIAKDNGLFVGDVEYDRSSKIYSNDISIRLKDINGNFSGVMKAVLNIEAVIDIIKELEPQPEYGKDRTKYFKLITKDGRIIYSTKKFKFFDNISDDLLSACQEKPSGYFIAPSDEPGEGKKLFAYAHSKGYKDYKGLGWILIIEHETKELFAPANRLKNGLLIIILGSVIFALLIGAFISRSISVPLRKLGSVAAEMGKGKLGVKTDIQSEDEVGFLANTFNKMSKDLLKLIEKEKELSAKTAAAEVDRKRIAELERAYSELEEAQYMLVQAEKMNAVGLLTSSVAHEVMNPLGIILQGINYLENKLSPKRKDISETLDALRDSIRRANTIVGSLIDFSKATAVDLEPEDINTVLENSLELAKFRFKFKNIDIVNETKKDLPKVLIDKNRIEQVFINVFLNAIQAMPEGGKIIIHSYDKQLDKVGNGVGRRKADYFKVGEKAVMIEIEDTGTGISEENLKRIFDPFFTTKGPRGASGLGLPVSQNIIAMHKGLIDVKSQIGKGTKVIVTLKPVRG